MYLLFAAHVRAEILPIGIGVVVKNTVSVWCLRALRLDNGNTQRNCLGARRPRRAGHTCFDVPDARGHPETRRTWTSSLCLSRISRLPPGVVVHRFKDTRGELP